MTTGRDPRIDLVARVTGAFAAEVERQDPGSPIPWPHLPDVRSMVEHVGAIHRWATGILLSGRPRASDRTPEVPQGDLRSWYADGAAELLEALATVPADEPRWIVGGGSGTAAFWRRRMVFENAKHLIDVRASGGRPWTAAPELTPDDYADGIDELLAEFLPRSRPGLPPLAGHVVLQATDGARSWRIGRDWSVDAVARLEPESGSRLRARTADLALMLWERADPIQETERFRIDGDRAAVATLRSASIHPW